jgi:hypothetical protein
VAKKPGSHSSSENTQQPPFGQDVPPERMGFDIDAWLSALERYKDIPFMENGREQPTMPDTDRTD